MDAHQSCILAAHSMIALLKPSMTLKVKISYTLNGLDTSFLWRPWRDGKKLQEPRIEQCLRSRKIGDLLLSLKSYNKAKAIRANLLDLDFDFEDMFRFGTISVLVTFQFW